MTCVCIDLHYTASIVLAIIHFLSKYQNYGTERKFLQQLLHFLQLPQSHRRQHVKANGKSSVIFFMRSE